MALTGPRGLRRRCAPPHHEGLISAKGRQITVEVNCTKIVDANLDQYTEQHAKKHPGLLRERGHLGLQSHGHRTDFRNLFVKAL